MKIYKYILVSFVSIYILSWILFGVKSAVNIPVDDFQLSPVPSYRVHTIHIFQKKAPLHRSKFNYFWKYNTTYSDKTIQNLAHMFEMQQCKNFIIHTDSPSDEMLHNLGYDNCILEFSCMVYIPFIAFVNTEIYAGSESKGWDSINVWFFKWFRVSYNMDWCS